MSIFISQQVKSITSNKKPTFKITNANNKTLTIRNISNNIEIRGAFTTDSTNSEQEITVSDNDLAD